jgi:hypothetical protein
LTTLPCPASASDDKRPAEPHFVVRCKPVDDWIGSLPNLTGGTPNKKKVAGYFDLLEVTYLGAEKLDGLDTTRPFGLYGFLNKDFDTMPDVFALVPITEEDAFLDLLKRAKCQVTKGNDGVHAVAAPMVPMPLHLRFANKHAYLSSLDKAAFAKAALLDPTKIAPLKGDNALATMVFRLDSIPLAVRKEAVAKTHEHGLKTYKEQLQAMPKTTDAAERAGREIGEKAIISLATDIQSFAASCIEDGDELILRLDDHWIIEVKLTPKPKSRLGANVASISQIKSRFGDLAGKNAIAVFNLRFTVPEKTRQSLEVAFDQSIDELLKNIKEEKERELTSKAFKSLMPTLKAGEIDVAFALRKGPKDQFATALFAAQIKDGAAVEQLLRDLSKEAGDKKLPIKLDVAKHGNVAIHRIDAKDLKGKGKDDPDFTSEIGENPAYLAVTADALFVTAGVNGLDAIKEALDSKPGACPPYRMQIGIAYLMAENAKNPQDKAMFKRLSGNFGLTVEGGDALTLRVEGVGLLPGAFVVGMEIGFEKAKEPPKKVADDEVKVNEQKAIQALRKLKGPIVVMDRKDGRLQLTVGGSETKDDTLAILEGLTEVTSLKLNSSSVTDKGLEHIKGMTGLKELDLSWSKVTDAGFEHLSGMSELETLTVVGDEVKDKGLVYLKRLSKLRHLNLFGTGISDAGMDDLKDLTQLTELNIGGSFQGISDEGLAKLKTLTNLKKLVLPRKITDAGLAHLKGFKDLETLELFDTPVSDEGLVHLKGLRKLTRLSLNRAKGVTDAGMVHLQGLENLTELNLHETKITDAGLTRLKGLKKLTHLSLGSTKITDVGLDQLQELTNLKEVNIFDTQVSDAGVKKLKEMHPGLRVIGKE